jgi:hypothetical protein
MTTTLVVQSHRSPLPFSWLQACIDSVAGWSQANHYQYRFIGDEVFDLVASDLRDKAGPQTVIATDLARLRALQQGLAEGFDCVVWCDADFLIFEPNEFVLPAADFSFGREVWVQQDDKGKLRAYPKLHNALLMFRRGNACLDFYIDTAERLLRLNQGGVPPQFIGPKLLTALHNIARFPVMETAGMLSPLVMRDLIDGEGEALRLFREKSPVTLAGANLSSSLTAAEGFTEAEMQTLIRQLLSQGI